MNEKYFNKFEQETATSLTLKNGIKWRDSLNGWRYIWKFDTSTTYKLLFGLMVSVYLWVYWRKMFGWYLLSTIAATHLQYLNSGVELLCDYLVDAHDPRIGIIKDYTAAVTNLPYLIWLALSGYVLYQIVF